MDPFADLDAAIERAGPDDRPGLITGLAARLAALGAAGMAPPAAAAADGDRNLDVEAAAQKLGMSREWVYRNAKVLPSVRLGRRLLFSERGLERYLARRAR